MENNTNFQNPYGADMPSFNRDFDVNDFYKDPILNPSLQYEQAYNYYKYLCMQLDYKIKCKEYEKLCNNKS